MLPWSPDTAQPAHSHFHAGKGKLAHRQVKQQDVFLASFFISRTQTQWGKETFKRLQEHATSLTTLQTTLLICKELLGNQKQDLVCFFSNRCQKL